LVHSNEASLQLVMRPCPAMMGTPVILITLCTVTTLRAATPQEAHWQPLEVQPTRLQAPWEPLDIQPTRLQALSKQAEAALKQVNGRRAHSRIDGDLKTEDDRQASVIEDMIKVIREAEKLNMSSEEVTAAAWGESQARNEVLQTAGSSVEDAQHEEGRAEALRVEASTYTQAAINVATRMTQVAAEAKAIADHLRNQKVTDVIQSVSEENQVALSQAKESIRMTHMAKDMIIAANNLARSMKMRARVAEDAARKAFAVAQRNSQRIAALKLRAVKMATQKAQLSSIYARGR